MHERLKAIFETLNHYAIEGQNVPVEVAAEICGVQPATMRRAIESGKCPFAFASKDEGKARGWYIISPWHLWRWCSGQTGGEGVT